MGEGESSSLGAPTWFAGLAPRAARAVLAIVVALVAWGVFYTATRDISPSQARGGGGDDGFYETVVQDMRSGLPYYVAAGSQLRRHGYAMSSVFNWRLPTLAWLFWALPSEGVARGLLSGVALLALLLWYAALRQHLRPAAAYPICLVLLGIWGFPLLAIGIHVHETWAAVAITLSIAASALGLTTISVLAGLAALAVRELSMAYVLVSLLLAWRARRSREVAAWLAGIVIFCGYYALHAQAVMRFQMAGDRLQPMSWLQFGGWVFVLKTAILNIWMLLVPVPLIAVVWPLALLGLLAWRTPLGRRTAATVYVYVVAFLFVGLPYNHLWGIMYAGLALPGLFFAPAALRDLWRRAWARSALVAAHFR